MADRCRSCNASITWVSIKGKAMPVDAEPSTKGNIRVGPPAEVLGNGTAEQQRAAGEELFLSHFATCPEGPQWRKHPSSQARVDR